MTISRRNYRFYRWFIFLVALLFLIYHFSDLTQDNTLKILLSVLGIILIHTLGVPLPSGVSLYFDFVIYAITLFTAGPVVMGWSALIANFLFLFLNEVRGSRKISLEQAFFNGAQFALSGFLAGWMYKGMHGVYGVDPVQTAYLLPAIYAILIFYLANSALVYTGFQLDPQINITNKQFRFYIVSDLGIYLFTSFTALMVLHHYPSNATFGRLIQFSLLIPFFISPMVAVHFGIRFYKQTEDLHQMFEIIRILNAPKNLVDCLHEIMTIIRPMVSFDQCCVWEADPVNGSISRLLMHYPESDMPPPSTISKGGGLRGQTVRSRTMLHIPDLRTTGNRSSMEPDHGTIVILPLIYENEVVGLIDFYKTYSHFFDKRNLPTMQAIADEIAVSIAKDRLFREVQRAAVTDKLTGLHNRLYFEDRFTYDVNRGQRYGQMVSLLFMDIDHFKICNDTYGHAAGDSILQQLAEILRTGIRKTDLIARYGGEELVIILPNTAKEQAAILAEKIRQTISTYEFNHENIKLSTTVSIGVATYPVDANDAPALVKRADAAMYMAKQQGRNRVALSSTAIPDMVSSQV